MLDAVSSLRVCGATPTSKIYTATSRRSRRLTDERGLAVFKLAAKADAVVENFQSDVKKRIGIDYESFAAITPRIVCGRISCGDPCHDERFEDAQVKASLASLINEEDRRIGLVESAQSLSRTPGIVARPPEYGERIEPGTERIWFHAGRGLRFEGRLDHSG